MNIDNFQNVSMALLTPQSYNNKIVKQYNGYCTVILLLYELRTLTNLLAYLVKQT